MKATEIDSFIFLDTCSLLESCWNREGNGEFIYSAQKAQKFWGPEMKSLICAGSVFLTRRNYEELIKLSIVHGDPKRPQLGERSEEVIKRLSTLVESKSIEIIGDPNDPFADAVLLSVALRFRTSKNLLFLTQDRALAHDLHSVSHFKSVRPRKGCELKVRRINRNGIIEPWYFKRMQPTSHPQEIEKTNCVHPHSVTDQPTNPVQEWWC